ncbi:MAG: membrane protein [Pseudonocardiaceae bacterium]|nr:membrane protein [Pseudonocardiaceae bacterium]
MATRPPVQMPKLSRRSRILLILAGIVVLLLLLGARLLDTYVNWLWFGEVGYRQVFTTQLVTRVALFFAVAVLVGGILAITLLIAYRTRPVFVPVAGTEDPLARYRAGIVQRVRLFGIGIPVIAGLIAGASAQSNWQVVQLFMNATNFGRTDPEFGIDIGFYAFKLPFYTWLLGWLFVGVVVSFIAAAISHYLFGGIRLAGRSGQLTTAARVQLAVTAGIFVLLKAVEYFLDRYELMFSDRNALFTGASYTDLNAVLPAKLILLFIAIICAAAFFAAAFTRNLQLPAIATVLMVLSSILIGAAWPAILEQFSVRPNAIQKESVPIERNLEATRAAYGLTEDKVTYRNYPGTSDADPAEVRANPTIPNIRVLDPTLLSPTFTQREGRQNFYNFPDQLDVDRYPTEQPDGSTKMQDYIVGLREINTNGLAENQQSWINRTMVYTHGNGFVGAPANTVDRPPSVGTEGASEQAQAESDQGGYPRFRISDLNGNNSTFPIKGENARVYYGELVTDYAIVGGDGPDTPREYDPRPAKTFKYNGDGGVPIGNWFNRLVFFAHEGERNILFSSAIGEGSKIMYNRNPRDRVRDVAPWLTVDGDPYPAVVNGEIKWIIDGYTTLENYPYAQRMSLGETTVDSRTGMPTQPDENISYARNSVKATVDAFDGSVNLYSVDDKDPVLKAWRGVFPGVVKPSSEMPKGLQQHLRYPEDLFKIQRELISRYHVTSPQDFYSTRTFWDVPPDPTADGGTDSNTDAAAQPPYYVLAQAPGQTTPTFQLTSALRVLERQFLGAWVSASSDPKTYGQFTVLRLPTENNQTEGPIQAQNRFQSTDRVTRERTLFQNPNVEPVYGNLLTLPVSGGIMYVEPIYIRRKDENAFPQLARMLVSYGSKVGFDSTVGGALDQVFGQGAGQAAAQQQGGDGSADQQPQQPGGGNNQQPQNPEMAAAVQEMQAALQKLRQAQQSGDFAAQGEALQELDAAGQRFEQAQGGS